MDKRSTMYTYKGKTQNIRSWAREYGIPYTTLMNRLSRGRTIEEALDGFQDARMKMVEYDGRTQSMTDWGAETGNYPSTISYRLKKHYPLKQVMTEGKLRVRRNGSR